MNSTQQKPLNRSINQQGFTLIELMATLAVLGLVVLIAVPSVGNVVKSAEQKADVSTVAMIENAASMALLGAVDYDDSIDERYDVSTLVEEGYLAIDEAHKFAGDGNYVVRVTGSEFVFTSSPENQPEPTSEDSFIWEYVNGSSGPIRILSYIGDDPNVVIPRELEGDPVTHIGYMEDADVTEAMDIWLDIYAFMGVELESVVIPDTITSIGAATFQNTTLERVVIPDSVTELGDQAFAENASLKSVQLSRHLTHIPYGAFNGTGLTRITIPDNVESIGDNAFAESRLSAVTFGSGVKTIGSMSFSNNDLTSLHLGNSIESIGRAAFADNPLTVVNIPNPDAYVGANAFDGYVSITRDR